MKPLLFVLSAFSLLLIFTNDVLAQQISLTDSGDVLLIKNSAYYEISVLKSNGAIGHVIDVRSGEELLSGSLDENLWSISFEDETMINSSEFAGTFSYNWNEENKRLILNYEQENAVTVSVTITPSLERYFDLQLSFTNYSHLAISSVDFPKTIKFEKSNILNGLFPDKPGVMLSSEYFKNLDKTGRISGIHPPALADYLGLQTSNTTFAMYPLWGTQALQISTFAFEPIDETNAGMSHGFVVWRPSGYTWTSVPVRIRLADSFEETLQYYRIDNQIDQYESVEKKLGSKYTQLINSPYISFPCDWNGHSTGWHETFKTMYAPALLLVMGYYSGGFHGHFPDVIPPDPALGTVEEFKAAMDSAHEYGLMTMPMVLPHWWHENSPTILNLGAQGLTVDSIAEIDQEGNLAYYFWELAGRQDYGYGVSPRHPFVQNRLADLMNTLSNEVGFDMIYEDVIGASNASSPNFNAYAPDTLDTEGWLDHTRKYKDNKLWTETGSDIFAETQIGFLGGGHGPDWTNSPNTKAWPMSGFLLKDKVLRYHYWGEVDKEAIAWNLAFGYMLSMQLNPTVGDAYPESGWFKVLHKFQTKVLSHYVDQLLISYTELAEGEALQFEYDSMMLIANPDTLQSFTYENYSIAPGGVLAYSPDRKVVGGIFSSFNNQVLVGDDQFLIIEQHSDSIEVSHPRGVNTDLTLNMHPNWNGEDTLWAKAYTRDGEFIDAIKVRNDTTSFTFHCYTRFQGRPVDHYQIVNKGLPPEPAWEIYCSKERDEPFILGNRNFYEIHVSDFSTALGFIIDKTSGDTLSLGSEWGRLWGIEFMDAPAGLQFLDPISSFVPDHSYSLEKNWSLRDSTLTFHYTSDWENGVDITVTITISTQNHLDMQLGLENNWGYTAHGVSFPHHLVYDIDATTSAIIATEFPGMRLRPAFFANQEKYESAYPSKLNSDFISLVQKEGNMSIYSLWGDYPVTNVHMGLISEMPGKYIYRHTYGVSVKNGENWTSPKVRIRIGQSPVTAMKAFKMDNEIEKLEGTLPARLDPELFDRLSKSALISSSFGDPNFLTFNEFASWADKLPSPSILMLSNYYSGGKYGSHPDILPPNTDWGTDSDFKTMIQDLKKQDKLLMPYTLPLWWNENSATIQGLDNITLNEITVKQHDGNLVRTSYNGFDFGYVVSPGFDIVENRIHENYLALTDEYDFDFVFEDHSSRVFVNTDHNPTYHQDWVDYMEVNHGSQLFISSGFDRILPNVVANSASIYFEAEGDTWTNYPFVPIVFHDRYLPFLTTDLPTNSKEMLSWNLLFGTSLIFAPDASGQSSWLDVIALFQSKAISRIIGKQMTDYDDSDPNFLMSEFEDIKVIRNNVSSNLSKNNHGIASKGAMLYSYDDSIIAGVFSSFNGASLTAGEHYLIIEAVQDTIFVSHPMGSNTPISIVKPDTWIDESRIHAYAVTEANRYELALTFIGNIQFDMETHISGQKILHFEVIYGESGAGIGDTKPIQTLSVHTYPNPFSNAVTISLELLEPSHVSIRIYNHNGQEVKHLLNENLPQGSNEMLWKGKDEFGNRVSSGIYNILVSTRDFEESIKVLLLH